MRKGYERKSRFDSIVSGNNVLFVSRPASITNDWITEGSGGTFMWTHYLTVMWELLRDSLVCGTVNENEGNNEMRCAGGRT